MNVLAHIAALLAWFVLFLYGLVSLNSDPLSYAVLAVGLLLGLVLLFEAALVDWQQLVTRKGEGRGFTRTSWAAVALVLLTGWWVGTDDSFAVGGSTTRDPSDGVALVNSASPVTAGNYDTYESPRGTDYQVPTGQTLYITQLTGSPQVATSTSETLTVGYGDTAVGDSTAAPDSAVVVFVTSWESVDGAPARLDVFVPVPAGKYPFVLPSGASNVQATGLVR